MAKMYFGSKRKSEPNLKVIIIIILVVLAGGYGLWRFASGDGPATLGAGLTANPSAETALNQARDLMASSTPDAARPILEGLISQSKDPVIGSQALTLLATLETNAGRKEEALQLLEKAANEFPGSPERPAAAARYARALEDAGQTEQAVTLFRELSENAPPGLRAPALAGLGRIKERGEDLVGARDLYREAVQDAPWNSEAWNEAADALGQANVALAFSPKETPESKYYIIEKGDNLTNIGIKLNTTLGLLTRANGIDESVQLRLGNRLKYTPKDFRIIIERSTCRLFLIDDRGLFKRYFVGLGMRDHQTAPGSYTIGNKQKDPTWFKPGAGPVPPGDPANELGTRWMPLVPAEAGLPTDLGIHGTIAPDTIGKYMSHGCPRMKKEDVEELYDLVVRSTPVKIVETAGPEEIG